MIWAAGLTLCFAVSLDHQLRKYLGWSMDWRGLFILLTLAAAALGVALAAASRSLRLEPRDLTLLFPAGLMVAGVTLVTGARGDDPLRAAWALLEYAGPFLLPFFLSFVPLRERDLERGYRGLAVWVALMAGVAAYQSVEFLLHYRLGWLPGAFFKNYDLEQADLVRLGLLRAPSLVGTPTEWGSVVLFFVLASLRLRNFRPSGLEIALVALLLASVTRSVYVCLAGIAFVILFLSPSRLGIREGGAQFAKLRLAAAALAGVVAVVGSLFALGHHAEPEFLQGADHLRGYATLAAASVADPLFGTGAGTFGSYVSFATRSPELLYWDFFRIFQDADRIRTLDSFWIQSYIELGAAGIGVLLGLFAAFFAIGVGNARTLACARPKAAALGFAALFVPVVYVLNGIAFSTYIGSYAWWSSLIAGMAWSLARSERRSSESGRVP